MGTNGDGKSAVATPDWKSRKIKKTIISIIGSTGSDVYTYIARATSSPWQGGGHRAVMTSSLVPSRPVR